MVQTLPDSGRWLRLSNIDMSDQNRLRALGAPIVKHVRGISFVSLDHLEFEQRGSQAYADCNKSSSCSGALDAVHFACLCVRTLFSGRRNTPILSPLFTAFPLDKIDCYKYTSSLFRQTIIKPPSSDFLIPPLCCNAFCKWQVQIAFSSQTETFTL